MLYDLSGPGDVPRPVERGDAALVADRPDKDDNGSGSVNASISHPGRRFEGSEP